MAPIVLLANFLFGQIMLPSTYFKRFEIIVCSLLAMFSVSSTAFATHRVPLPVVQLIRSTELAFLFIIQTFFFKIIPSKFSVIGSAIVITTLILLISRAFIIDYLKHRKESNQINTNFHKFLVFLTK